MSLDTSVPGSAPAASGRIIARYPLLKGMEVPAQAYAGIESPLPR